MPSASVEQPFSSSAPARFHHIVPPNPLAPKLMSGSAPPLSHSRTIDDTLSEAIKVKFRSFHFFFFKNHVV